MAKVIIGIHGLGNKPPKDLLETWWRNSIEEGINKVGKPNLPFKFELVYWADVLYENPLEVNRTNDESQDFLREKYVPASGNFVPEDHSTRKKVLDFLSRELDTIFLNEDYTLNYSFVTDTILKRYFRDLDIYYKETCTVDDIYCEAKDVIRKRVAQTLRKYQKDEILLIGHSMGSIIGFDVLSFDVPDISVDTFITLGSPLGLPIVKSKIAAEYKINHNPVLRLKTPTTIKRNWFNFSDLEDKVAFNYQLSDDFTENEIMVKPQDFVVNNDYEINGERNPHKSYGYLRTPEFTHKLLEFLEYQKPLIWNKWVKNIRIRKMLTKLFSRINHSLLRR